jgi:hypothetical protein
MTTLPDLRVALAELGIALLVLRVETGRVDVDGMDQVGGLLPIAIVWDDDVAEVRARIRAAIGRLTEQFPLGLKAVAKAG